MYKTKSPIELLSYFIPDHHLCIISLEKTFLQLQLANTQAVAPYMDIVSNAMHKITQPDTETQVFRIDNSLWEGF